MSIFLSVNETGFVEATFEKKKNSFYIEYKLNGDDNYIVRTRSGFPIFVGPLEAATAKFNELVSINYNIDDAPIKLEIPTTTVTNVTDNTVTNVNDDTIMNVTDDTVINEGVLTFDALVI
jgi:hypothetical protein